MKFKYIISTAVLCLLITFLYSDYNGLIINQDLNSTLKPDHILLSWTGDPETTQTISFRSSTAVTNGLVKYRESSEIFSVYKTADAFMKDFEAVPEDTSGKFHIFTAELKGLKPGTSYDYMVMSGNQSSGEMKFTTEALNTESFKFLIFGDSQSGNPGSPDYREWNKTVTKAYAGNRNARFIVNMGDMVELGQSYIHWDNWFNAARDVIDRVPEVPVQGNHETYLPGWKNARPVYFKSQFPVFQNGPEGLKGQVYSFDYGNIHITVLDSQYLEEHASSGDILPVQTKWLEKDLASTTKTWKLVFFHKTPYYNFASPGYIEIKKNFTPLLEKYHADIVFNGHDHIMSRTYPISNGVYYSSPAQGTVYYVTGRSGPKFRTGQFGEPWNAFAYNPIDRPCYETVDIIKDRLTVKCFKQDGSLVDTYTIDKGHPENSTKLTLPAGKK
jgi:acid phosphatase type 7